MLERHNIVSMGEKNCNTSPNTKEREYRCDNRLVENHTWRRCFGFLQGLSGLAELRSI